MERNRDGMKQQNRGLLRVQPFYFLPPDALARCTIGQLLARPKYKPYRIRTGDNHVVTRFTFGTIPLGQVTNPWTTRKLKLADFGQKVQIGYESAEIALPLEMLRG